MIRFYKLEDGVFKEGVGTKIPEGFIEFQIDDADIIELRRLQHIKENEEKEAIRKAELEKLREELNSL
jgi:hypothetical protein